MHQIAYGIAIENILEYHFCKSFDISNVLKNNIPDIKKNIGTAIFNTLDQYVSIIYVALAIPIEFSSIEYISRLKVWIYITKMLHTKDMVINLLFINFSFLSISILCMLLPFAVQ